MIFPCLPKIKRCCYFTHNLKLACLLIVIWSMLTACHSFRILLSPLCKHQYDENGEVLNEVLNYLKWILVFINMFTILASFGFLLGLFFKRQVHFSTDLFLCAGIFSSVIMLGHGITTIIYVYSSDCNDISDGLAFILYFFVWCYFIVVVNSFSDEWLE